MSEIQFVVFWRCLIWLSFVLFQHAIFIEYKRIITVNGNNLIFVIECYTFRLNEQSSAINLHKL